MAGKKKLNLSAGTALLLLAGALIWWMWPLDFSGSEAPASDGTSSEQASVQSAESAANLHSDIFIMDAHTHLINQQLYLGGDISERQETGQVDLPRIREGGLNAIFLSLGSTQAFYPHRYELKHTLMLLEEAHRQIENNSDRIELALNASDIERITAEGKLAAFLDLEGAFDLDGDLTVLRALYRMGLRSVMMPAHNRNSHFADSCCDPPRLGGINEHGRELIRELNRLGMIINVAHGSNETILQTVEASEDPVLWSHGGLRHFVPMRRSLSDEGARAIAENGGVIALHPGNVFNNVREEYEEEFQRRRGRPRADLHVLEEYEADSYEREEHPQWTGRDADYVPFDELMARVGERHPVEAGFPVPDEIRMTVDEFVDVIDYAVREFGEDHVALGVDFGGAVFPPRDIDDISDYSKFTEGMVRRGYSEERIRKIMGENLLRLIREVTE